MQALLLFLVKIPTRRSMQSSAMVVILAVAALWLQGCLSQPNMCMGPVQKDLLYGVAADRSTAVSICCHNTDFAEYSGYFESVGLFGKLDSSGVTTFYDSVCGKPLFRAPVGRSFEDWQTESEEHGWPSFRSQEILKENVDFRGGGEMRSTCGTHLGHNIPDGSGDRYCIDLVCIAGSPLPNLNITEAADMHAIEATVGQAAVSRSLTSVAYVVIMGSASGILAVLVMWRSCGKNAVKQPLLGSIE